MASIHYDSEQIGSFEESFSSARGYLSEAKRIADSFIVPNYYFDYFAHSSYLSGLGGKIGEVYRESETVSEWVKGSKSSYTAYSDETVDSFDAVPDVEIKPRSTVVVAK